MPENKGIAEIIAVGEEVLSGDVINTNAGLISRYLAEAGVVCRYHSVVGDNPTDIIAQLQLASGRSSIIVLIGGLGPTEDDLTRESVAAFVGKPLVESPVLKQQLEQWFKHRNYPITANNYKQALVIEGAISIPNQNGTAPGMHLEYQQNHLFLLPGPPRELKPMVEQYMLPLLRKRNHQIIVSKTFKLINIGESTAVSMIPDLIQDTPEFRLAPYAKLREVHLKATSMGQNQLSVNRRMEEISAQLKQRLGQYIYTDTEQDLMDVIVEQLIRQKQTIAVAESISGGQIASMFVDKSGVSQCFQEGLVVYSNAAKQQRLGVKEQTLQEHGAVSRPVAHQMAAHLVQQTGYDYAIATTGIAGPTGGSPEKPIGLVYIAVGSQNQIEVFEHHFSGDRKNIRDLTAKTAVIHLYNRLFGE